MSTDKDNATLNAQLGLLHELMKETSSTANTFLGQFHFGGIIAVIGLLNVDLILLNDIAAASSRNLVVYLAIALGALVISAAYFRLVVNHYQGHRRSHRKLKYKFELTLHALLCHATPSDYAKFLERSVAAAPPNDFQDVLPDKASNPENFHVIAGYLLHHHQKRYADLHTSLGNSHFWIAMLMVFLTLSIRLTGLLLERS